MVDWFSRTESVVGIQNIQKMACTTVAVVGLGGVGGAAAEALARVGIGSLILIDPDIVSLTNLNRQIVALQSTLGEPKVKVMADRIREINPHCSVQVFAQAYQAQRASILQEADFVVDAIDSVLAKTDLIEYCVTEGLPIISSLGTGNRMDPTCLVITDLVKTYGCPLARSVRAALRKKNVSLEIPVVFSTERPKKNRPGNTPGSTALVPPVAGLFMASWVVEKICGEA